MTHPSTPCPHQTDHELEYGLVESLTWGEIDMCPLCGALFDRSNPESGYGERPMTVEELNGLVRAELEDQRREILRAVTAAINAFKDDEYPVFTA